MKPSPEPLARLRRTLEPMLQREATARALSGQVPAGVLFVGLCGTDLDEPTYEILPGLVVLRRVTNAPGIVDVYRAADLHRTDHLAIGRYSAGISAELVVGDPALATEDNSTAFLHELAWHAAALLKVRGAATIFAPGSATASWDTIAARTQNDVLFTLLDDAPRQIRLPRSTTGISRSDLEWVAQSFEPALRLRDFNRSRRFGLAFNVAYTWNHTGDLRMALGNLWVGIEALFGERADRPVTKKLADRVAAWLPGTRDEAVEDLYNRRCDAVHGRWLDDRDLAVPVSESWELLRSCIVQAIEREATPLSDWGREVEGPTTGWSGPTTPPAQPAR